MRLRCWKHGHEPPSRLQRMTADTYCSAVPPLRSYIERITVIAYCEPWYCRRPKRDEARSTCRPNVEALGLGGYEQEGAR